MLVLSPVPHSLSLHNHSVRSVAMRRSHAWWQLESLRSEARQRQARLQPPIYPQVSWVDTRHTPGPGLTQQQGRCLPPPSMRSQMCRTMSLPACQACQDRYEL